MNKQLTAKQGGRQQGFILAIVLVFLIVLSAVALFGTDLTRTNIQIVNNLQNEKEAFAIASAGIHEALYRISLAIGDRVTVNGQTFNASLAPTVPGRSAPVGVTSYGIDSGTSTATSQIVFTTSGVPATGTNNAVPTLQPVALQLPYSSSTADTAPVSLNTTANLTIGWDVCAAPAPSVGCDTANGFYPIRGLPISSPRPVAKIVSTGRSGTAMQKITAWVVDCIPSATPGDGSVVSLGTGCAPGMNIALNGNASITAAGMVQVNAGADSNPPSSCTDAAETGNNQQSFIHASDINVVGLTQGNFAPPADTGVLPMADPYAGFLPPCYTGGPAQCQGPTVSAAPCAASSNSQSPATCQAGNNAVLNPGIYYGGIRITGTNVTMNPGTYIIAGGGFSVGTGTTSVSSAPGGVFIYNTQNPDSTGFAAPLGPAASFDITNGSCTAALAAPTSGTFAGVVLYQDTTLTPQPDIYIQGGQSSARVLDGLVYAPYATLHIQGNNPTTVGGSLIVQSIYFNGGSDLTVQSPSTSGPHTICGGVKYQIIGWQD
jgi:hypothetical protein